MAEIDGSLSVEKAVRRLELNKKLLVPCGEQINPYEKLTESHRACIRLPRVVAIGKLRL